MDSIIALIFLLKFFTFFTLYYFLCTCLLVPPRLLRPIVSNRFGDSTRSAPVAASPNPQVRHFSFAPSTDWWTTYGTLRVPVQRTSVHDRLGSALRAARARRQR